MKTALASMLALMSLTLSIDAHAQLACDDPPIVDEYYLVKDRYRIAFQTPQEGESWIIWRPIPENRGKYAVGQSSGQTIAELEDALDFEGRILALWDFSNAIDVCMSAQQAQRWSADPRVRSVTPRVLMYSDTSPPPGGPDPARFRNHPQLTLTDSYTLKLPFVDFNGIPGQYQDVKIEYLPQAGTWRLSGYKRLEPFRSISTVDVIVTDEIPAQVFLDIRGTRSNGCGAPGQAGISQSGNAFTVFLFYQYVLPDCIGTDDFVYIRKIVPLDVYGLPAGSYTWTLNGKFEGSFTLPSDNVID